VALRIIFVVFSVALAFVVLFAAVTTAKRLSSARAAPPARSVNS
jgi:hypothetical protein